MYQEKENEKGREREGGERKRERGGTETKSDKESEIARN